MGFLTGFGEGLQRSTELEQQAQIAKKAELQRAQLKLAELLINSPDPEHQAQGFAIYSDPNHPFSMDKPHPNLPQVQNVLQALGTGEAAKSVVSGQSPPGMIGMLGPDNSPLVQNGIIGDQEAPSVPGDGMPEAPPLPPTPAAMTTNPPATEGGKINPAAAAPPAGMPPPAPPAGIAPAPPPPSAPPAIAQAIAAYEAGQPPAPGLNAQQQQLWYTDTLKHADTLRKAKALQAAGASEDEIRAVLSGREGTQVITTGMREEGRDADRALKEYLGKGSLEQRQREAEAKISLAKDRVKQDWAKHLDNIAVRREGIAKSGSGTANRAEEKRLEKLQVQAAKAMDGATEGIAGVENLRTQFQLYDEIPFGISTALDKKRAWDRYSAAVSSEAQRMARSMMAMTLPGNRGATEARVKAMERELATLWGASKPEEVRYRLDNVESLIRVTEEEIRGNIEKLAATPIKVGESPLPPPRPPKDLSNVPGGPDAQKTGGATPPGAIPPGAKVGKNPKTGQRIYSVDGGKTWLDAATGKEFH